MTLLEVSQKTGIDTATLSRIENGKMTGTVRSHLAIANALDVRLPDLYEKSFDAETETAQMTQDAEPPVFSQSGDAVSELLAENILQRKMIPVRARLKAMGKTTPEELPLGTERFVYILSGTVEIQMKDSRITLKEGEYSYINAAVRHSFENPVEPPCTFLILTTSPSSLILRRF